MVIGCGQCGGRIADEFARLNKVAHIQRGIDIITNAVAVNTDIADLSGLYYIKPDFRHRILIGSKKTGGHGVGKMNEIGAEIAREDGDKIIESIRAAEKLPETDAILVVASAAGGTGSGSISVLTQQLKERYTEKPVYNLIVLPFQYEEVTEERSVFNVGTCLKSSYLVADAVFLVDNQRYIRKNASIRNNLSKINYMVVKPLYNVLCAGEETEAKYIGSRVLDAGDIIQTLSGWTVIGYGTEKVRRIKLPFEKSNDFRDKSGETQRGVQSISEALDELSLKCNPTDSRKALYLLTAPYEAMNMDLIKELSASLKDMASEAIIRSGDYPRGKGSLEVTVILSELVNSRKVIDYFAKAIDHIALNKRRQGGIEWGNRGLEEAFKDIPSLL
ncbi:MAG TPA: cell division protein FtsZ [Dehalococcoidia bacterium]|nr:cell division protein FtsZ [Dehalococcoidia bacterium]